MSESFRERLRGHQRLAAALGPALVERGALQHFFVSPALPQQRLSADSIAAQWRQHVAQVAAGHTPEALQLYVHIPFCSHRCHYCIYHSTADFAAADVDSYLHRLREEMSFYAPLFRGVRFINCYLGGGTPTVLDEAQLGILLDHLDQSFERQRGGEWAFECNPLTATKAKARIFREHRFNRVSFGVQTLNPSVLERVNRGYQSYERVAQTIEVMKDCGFWTSVDLLYGLPDESTSSRQQSFDRILQLAPSQVVVYGLSPHTPGGLAPQQLEPPAAVLAELAPSAERYGYRAKSGTTNLGFARIPQPGSAPDLLTREAAFGGRRHGYDDTTVEPFSLLAFGPTARGYVVGQLRYRFDPYPPEQAFDPSAECAEGRVVSPDEERRRYAVHQLGRRSGLRRQPYQDRFDEPVEEAFGEVLGQLRDAGLLAADESAITHTSSDPATRFAVELFFVPPAMLAYDAARRHPGAEQVVHRPAESPGDPAPTELELVLRVPGLGLRVVLVDHREQRRCFAHAGGFAFFVPSELPEGTCQLGVLEHKMLEVFTRLFRQVIDTHAPADCAALQRALVAAGQRCRTLRVAVAQRGSGPA